MCYKYILLDSEIFTIETFIFLCDFDQKCLADVRGLERNNSKDVFIEFWDEFWSKMTDFVLSQKYELTSRIWYVSI